MVRFINSQYLEKVDSDGLEVLDVKTIVIGSSTV